MDGPALVERFLHAMGAMEWDAMGAALADDVVRVGPYGDVKRGRAEYVRFIADLLPTLPGYRMDVHRVEGDDRVVVAELSETVDVDGHPLCTDEALVFDLDGSAIVRIAVYVQKRDA